MIEFQSYLDIPHNFTGICKITSSGTIYHYKDGKRHNENGPAVVCKDGAKIWYINGLRHREDGPAEEYINGSKGWYYKGEYCGAGSEYCGAGNKFTNETWKEKVEYLKREEELQIFL